MLGLPVRSALTAVAVLTSVLLPLASSAAADTLTTPAGPATPATASALRIAAPGSVPAGSHADVWTRLVRTQNGGEEPLAGKPVLVQRQTPDGWVQVASLRTRDDGLAHGPVTVNASARFRAVFRGDTGSAAATSRVVVIAATTLGDRAVAEAKRHRGARYAAGAAGPSRFDCSGYTMYVFRQLHRSLPHSSSQQADATRRIADSAKRPGDLIFTYHGSRIGHVGIYAGGAKMWASVQSGDVVRLQSFEGRAYSVGRVA
jgi:cell wall-associated NlpC family hydrolase